ncbi:TPA: hypothetical protein N3A37_004648, partial [Salmonella enterica subsp. salamae serovar 56:z10:e,n,x]|nr:hypothetical protein [Salmonella enterica subsp. salamae serovar 56:z10:e,n,x]
MQLDFTLNFHNDTWYPTVDISGFKSTTGANVDIQEKMILTFSAPGKITAGDITISTNPWCELKTNIETSEISSGVFDSKLTITAADGSALGNAISTIHMGVNASSDTAPKWETFSSAFTAAADEEADVAGELAVTCAAFPAGLENAALELILVRGEKSETLHPKAGITRFNIDAGAYAVTAAEIRTAEGTIRAAVQLNASELTITKGQLTQLDITFAQAEYSTTLDLAVNLPVTHALYNEDLSVVYMENGVAKQRYTMRAGQKQRLELLPVTGIYSVRIDDVKLNNIHYTFDVASGALDNQLHDIAFTSTHQNDESQSASTKLTISIDAEKTVASTFSLRLVDDSTTPRQYLFTDLAMKAGSFTPSVELAPG